jgi:hemerythrin-like domain-containing protein
MSHPLHQLKHEHRVIERSLNALDGVCLRLEWGEHVAPEVLARLVDFFTSFADGSHHKREELRLFPALEGQGILRQGGPLEVMESQHQIERDLTAEMDQAVSGYRDVDPAARHRFIEAARRYSDHLSDHIYKEDSMLFRIAEEILDDEEMNSLTEAFRQEESRFGAGNLERYEQMASEMERTFAV